MAVGARCHGAFFCASIIMLSICNFATVARQLASSDIPVIPVSPTSKHPFMRDWPEKATTEQETIDRWATKWPNHNCGICTTNRIGIDCDGECGHHNLEQLQQRYGKLPPTMTTRSPGGAHHYHLLYDLPDGIQIRTSYGANPNHKRVAIPGCDVIGWHGHMVGPGSIHKSGNPYVAEIPPSERTIAPDWLIDLCQRKTKEEIEEHYRRRESIKQGTATPYSLAAYCQQYPINGPGQRYQRCLYLIGSMFGKGNKSETIKHAMRLYLTQFEDHYDATVEDAIEEANEIIRKTEERIVSGLFTVNQHDVEFGRPLPANLDALLEGVKVLVSPSRIPIVKGLLQQAVIEIEKVGTDTSSGEAEGSRFSPNTVLGENGTRKQLEKLDITFTMQQLVEHMKHDGIMRTKQAVGHGCESIMSQALRNGPAKDAKELELFVRTQRGDSVRPFNACHASPLLLEIADDVDSCLIEREAE